MKKIWFQLSFVLLAIVSSQIPAVCQTTYSLSELAGLANKHSETIKIAEEDLDIAHLEKARALSVLIPRATTFGSMTGYKNDSMTSPDTKTLGIKLTQSFTLNGKELIALNVTQNGIEGKAFSLESIRAQYLLQVSQAYYNILSAQRYLEIAQSDVVRLTTHRDAVKEKLIVGNVTKTDLFRAEAELSKSLTEKVKAENGILLSKAVLRNLVEIEPDYHLKKADLEDIEKYHASLEEIQTHALKNRTEIKQAKKNLEIARKTVKYEKSDFWPTISLEAGYKETDFRYESSPRDADYDTEDLYVKGELVFTLYDGGLRNAQIKQSLANQRKAENALKLQEKKVVLDAKISFLDYITAKSTLLNLQDELKFAQENFNAVQMQFKYGMADSIDIMDANTLLVTAQRRISDAEYTYYLSVLNIIYTKGDLIQFFLDQA